MTELALKKRLRLSATLVTTGLVVEVASLTWSHPTAFIVFVGIGGLLMAAGMLWFLYSIVSRGG
ncbi:MAG TPA: hypothetical protein VF997_12835 [Polyangia bacterium]